MNFRVAEINPAYNFIPSEEYTTDETGEMKQTKKGPGWIYITNIIDDFDVAAAIALEHFGRTRLKTRIDTIIDLCLPTTSQ